MKTAGRWFEALRRVFANRIFKSLDHIQEALAAASEESRWIESLRQCPSVVPIPH